MHKQDLLLTLASIASLNYLTYYNILIPDLINLVEVEDLRQWLATFFYSLVTYNIFNNSRARQLKM